MKRVAPLSKIPYSLLFTLCFLSGIAAAPKEDPAVTDKLIEQLKTMPFSIAGRSSVLIRDKHIESVQFFGDGIPSQFGYIRKMGIRRQGLWMRFRSNQKEGWSRASIQFRQPLDISRFNSLVLWVRSDHPDKRFWISMQDAVWKHPMEIQSRTDIIPADGFPKDEVFQLVIPFSDFIADASFDYSKVVRLTFEFGQDTVGNPLEGTLEVLGSAFVKQDRKLETAVLISTTRSFKSIAAQSQQKRPHLFTNQIRERFLKSIEMKKAKTYRGPESVPGTLIYFSPITSGAPYYEKPDRESMGLGHLVVGQAYLALQSEGAGMDRWFYLQVDPEKKGWVRGANLQFTFSEKNESSMAASSQRSKEKGSESMMAPPVAKREDPRFVPLEGEPNEEELLMKEELKTGYLFLFFFGLAAIFVSLLAWLLAKKATLYYPRRVGHVLHVIAWPSVRAVWDTDLKAEKTIWKSHANNKVTDAILSVENISLRKDETEQYHGQNFLMRQIKLARKVGIQMVPSLNFVRTVFQYEQFLANPRLYLWKPVPSHEHRFSDDELRIKYMGYFPVWVPPFSQKKYGLPQRLLVAYGKMPGVSFTSDSVQFNLTSLALRGLAAQLIRQFARVSHGVRLEGTASLLTDSIHHFWNGQLTHLPEGTKEFWGEVISEVKRDFPRFLFIASGVGSEEQSLLKQGFDYFENDWLVESITNQIRLESVGNLAETLSEKKSPLLQKSIYNVSPLFEVVQPTSITHYQDLLSGFLLSLMPGRFMLNTKTWIEFSDFFRMALKHPALKGNDYVFLNQNSPEIFGLARWNGKSLMIIAANFSAKPQGVAFQLKAIREAFEDKRLYLFNDALYGSAALRRLKTDQTSGPAVPVLGMDIKDKGVPIKLNGLSLKVISVNLFRPLPSLKELRKEILVH